VISKKVVALCAAFGVALTGAAITVPAVAEPVSNSYAIVGSDTLEDAVNGLVNGTTLSGASFRAVIGGASLGSFDATGTPCVITKPYGVRFGRPNGSSDGVKALSRSIDGGSYTSGTTTCGDNNGRTITGMVDIARSSSAGTSNGAGELLYVPFGRDAIGYAYHSASTAPGIDSLDATELASIFSCTGTNPTVGGVRVYPVLPQSGSGTGKDFISKLGLASSFESAPPACVTRGQEHDGNSLTAANYIMPMSISRWVAMTTGATASKKGAAVLAGLDNVPHEPVTGTGAAMVPNQPYYDDVLWGRDTYLVVEYRRVNPANTVEEGYDVNLADIMDPSITDSLTNSSSLLPSYAGAVKKKYGFLAPDSTTSFRVLKSS
jgi:hypothetical protein